MKNLKIYKRFGNKNEFLKTDRTFKVLLLANYYVCNHSTLREVGNAFGVSKTTLHNIFTKGELEVMSYSLYLDVQDVLIENKKSRHIHGGEVTKQKYLKIKNTK